MPADVPALVALGIEALNEDPYTELIIDPEKVRKVAVECVSAATNFAWVAERDGEVAGAVCAIVVPMMFYERSQASVVMYYCRRAPGEGIALLREFLRWARARPVIKLIEFTLERHADPRIGKLLTRLGLRQVLPIYIQLR